MQSKAETDTVQPVVASGSVSCVRLLNRGIGCETGVAAARSSAEMISPSISMAKIDAKTVSAAGEINPRPVQHSVVATKAET